MRYGRGFGFRGASPAWPYVGRGRGGLPRCYAPGLARGYYPTRDYRPYPDVITSEQELVSLREESAALKKHLEDLETRISELETGQSAN
jgi:hypothetical protein